MKRLYAILVALIMVCNCVMVPVLAEDDQYATPTEINGGEASAEEPEQGEETPTEEPEQGEENPTQEPEQEEETPAEEPEQEEENPTQEPEQEEETPAEEPEQEEETSAEEPEQEEETPAEESEQIEEAPAEELSDFTIDGNILVAYLGTASSVTVPDGIEIIGENAFKGNKALKTVTLPDSVTTIRSRAFADCEKLQKVEIGSKSGLKTIEAYAFQNDEKLDITFANAVKDIEISADAFDGCITDEEPVEVIASDETEEIAEDNDDVMPVSTGITITKQPQDIVVQAGKTATFSVTAVGDGLTYQWQYLWPSSTEWKNSGAASAKTASYSFTMSKSNNGMKARCIIKDQYSNSLQTDAAVCQLSAQ